MMEFIVAVLCFAVVFLSWDVSHLTRRVRRLEHWARDVEDGVEEEGW